MYVFLSVILALLGILMLFKPLIVYNLLESWKNNGSSEPSKFYVINLRIGGAVFLVVGILGTVVLSLI